MGLNEVWNSVNYCGNDAMYYDKQYHNTNVSDVCKTEYEVKKGDNLWDIAKKHLNDSDATNAEIQNMMYKIAKLNKKDNVDSVNNIKIGDIIYLPQEQKEEPKRDICYVADWFNAGARNVQQENQPIVKAEQENKVPNLKETTAALKEILELKGYGITHSQKELYRWKSIDKIPDDLYIAHGRAGIKYWTDILSHRDNTLIVKESYSSFPSQPTGLHIVKKADDKYNSPTEAGMYVSMDRNGNLISIAFYSPGMKIHSIKFDYQLEQDGRLTAPKDVGYHRRTLEKLDTKEYADLQTIVKQYINESLK